MSGDTVTIQALDGPAAWVAGSALADILIDCVERGCLGQLPMHPVAREGRGLLGRRGRVRRP